MSTARETDANKQLVRRLVQEVVNERDSGPPDELAAGASARLARRWITPSRPEADADR
jgi:hypothetical protein